MSNAINDIIDDEMNDRQTAFQHHMDVHPSTPMAKSLQFAWDNRDYERLDVLFARCQAEEFRKEYQPTRAEYRDEHPKSPMIGVDDFMGKVYVGKVF